MFEVLHQQASGKRYRTVPQLRSSGGSGKRRSKASRTIHGRRKFRKPLIFVAGFIASKPGGRASRQFPEVVLSVSADRVASKVRFVRRPGDGMMTLIIYTAFAPLVAQRTDLIPPSRIRDAVTRVSLAGNYPTVQAWRRPPAAP
jgi:hypothetical protein